MSCTYIFSRNERLYLQVEGSAAWGTIPNAAGTATVAGSNYCRHISLALDPAIDIYTRADKTGNRSIPQGTPGREQGSFKVKLSLAGNGTPGVRPDMDPLLQAIFGKAATVVASTSTTYGLSDSIPSLDVWSFRTDNLGTGNPNQRVGVGSIVTSSTFTLGEDIATVDIDGLAKLVLGSFDFAARGTAGDNAGQSGLTAFPVEPANPVSNGNAVQGFYGALTMDGQVLTTIKSASIKVDTGNKFSQVFGSKYPGCPIGAVRTVTYQCELYDGSDAATKDIYQRAYDKNPLSVVMQVGNVAGNTWTFTVSGLQLAPYTYDDSSDTYMLKFGDSKATSNTGLTELALVIT